MDIVIIADFLGRLDGKGNSRFLYLADMLCEKHNVEIITSDFNHGTKDYFSSIVHNENYKITMLHEGTYHKNVSIKRFFAHYVWGCNVGKYLKNRKKPDVVYCAVPTLMASYEAARYCEENGIKFIVDVQDLWPEAFQMFFNIPVVSDIIFLPFRFLANGIYKRADEIVAVSKTYAERAKSVNKKCEDTTIVYLGTERESFDTYAQEMKKKENEIVIAYVGSMGDSYDLVSVIDAIADISVDVPIKLLAMGDGSSKDMFVEHAMEKEISVEFTGALPYAQMIGRLCSCDIAVNPIHKGSAGSILNKVGDYAMAGLPVVNSQESREYRELLTEYQAGINCECENVDEIVAAFKKLIIDKDLRAQMATNSRRLGVEKFDHKNAYQEIVHSMVCVDNMPKTGRGVKLAYCGTLGHSYDLTCVIDAIKNLEIEERERIRFIVMGDGPRKEEFIKKSEGLPIIFTGRLAYSEMVWILSRCHIAVNPITKGAAQSIINKHMDYAMAGLPVLNTQECEEYRVLVEEYGMGINCKNDDAEDLSKKLKYLMNNEQIRNEMGRNARRCAEERFDRARSYKEIIDLITQ